MRKVLVGFCIGLLLLLPQKALALDYLYLLLGNGQDLLILGQLVEGSLEEGYRVDVSQAFFSAVTINTPYELPAEIPQQVQVAPFTYTYGYDAPQDFLVPRLGDKVFLSLNRTKGELYQIAHGAYVVDSLDPASLRIQVPQATSQHTASDYIAMLYFIRSNGAEVLKSWDNEEQVLYFNDGITVPYSDYQKLLYCSDERGSLPVATTPEPEQPGQPGQGFIVFLGVACGLGIALWLLRKQRRAA